MVYRPYIHFGIDLIETLCRINIIEYSPAHGDKLQVSTILDFYVQGAHLVLHLNGEGVSTMSVGMEHKRRL